MLEAERGVPKGWVRHLELGRGEKGKEGDEWRAGDRDPQEPWEWLGWGLQERGPVSGSGFRGGLRTIRRHRGPIPW